MRRVACILATASTAWLAAASDVRAQVLLDSLPQIENVGIVERKGEQVPGSLTFTDAQGRTRTMGEFFDGKRPVMLVMAYYDCPLLCTLVLNQVQRVMNEVKWTAGVEFELVTVSFDHTNTTAMAREKRDVYLAGYAREAPPARWEFLTGDVDNIRGLAAATGYHYKFLPETNEFSHPAALIFLAPDGKVHNYIEKLNFTAGDVRLALTEAAEGRIGTIFDRIAHFCFTYNPKTGQYTADAFNVMRIGATTCGLGLAAFVARMIWSRRRALAATAGTGRDRAARAG
ncbi:MAG: SCO family protein [Planctomycetota bacterium]|nr:SCO family protein [Planctomycetota bacterium]